MTKNVYKTHIRSLVVHLKMNIANIQKVILCFGTFQLRVRGIQVDPHPRRHQHPRANQMMRERDEASDQNLLKVRNNLISM